MTNALQEATKEKMEYTEERRTCEYCKYRQPTKGGYDPGWDDECTYNNLCSFIVKLHGSCKFFTPKTTPHE